MTMNEKEEVMIGATHLRVKVAGKTVRAEVVECEMLTIEEADRRITEMEGFRKDE